MSRRVKRTLIFTGLAAVCAGGADSLRMNLWPPEKSAYCFLGHCFDAVWQVQVPLMALGVVLPIAAVVCFRGSKS